MVIAEPGRRTGERRRTGTRALWRSTIGKKIVMALSGLVLLVYLVAHMLGNLKVFFGPDDIDAYGHWLRTIGAPVLHGAWFLWGVRAVLAVAVVLHVTAAAQLSRRDLRARPVRYASGQRPRATFATRTMRWGGTILALFVVWHVLDLSAGAVNPDFHEGHVYDNITADFRVWWIDLVYIVAMLMLGLHVNHGFWSAAQTLGVNRPARDRVVKAAGTALATALTVGFVSVPVAVMTGVVS